MLLGHCGASARSGCLGRFLNETGNRLTRLGAFAQPIFCPLQIQGEIVAFPQRLIRPQLLDELAVSRTAAIRYHNAEYRGVLCPHPLHANFNCHKSTILQAAATQAAQAKGLPKRKRETSLAPTAWQVLF